MQRFQGHALVSDQVSAAQIAVLWRELAAVLDEDVPGNVVEFGCYTGTASLFLRRVLDAQARPRELHVYDSFAGLPAKTSADASAAGEAFRAGELLASRRQLLRHFRQAGLQPPFVHKGWFDRLLPGDVPEHICFAFLDGDFYGSILASLRLVWPRLSPGAAVIIDDYRREALPGVAKAVRDYFNGTVPAVRVERNMGILKQ